MFNLGAGSFIVTIPRTYVEYATDDWDPPSRWDEGISGLF